MTRITRRKLPGNWDGTLTGDMINYTENRDSIGFDAKTNRWYAPEANKGYDSNQRGMGVDINTNQYVKEFLKKDERGVYLTKEDERYIRHKSLDDAFDSYNDRVSHAKKIIQVNKDPSELRLLKPVQHNWMEKPIYFNGGKLNK